VHISEGILSWQVLTAGAALAAAGTGIGLKKLDYDQVARVGLLSACFFVASLIHVPIGPSSIHLILNGVLGLLLGWAAFPAILVALLLQAVFFQFGGITTLGVNTVLMALPALACYLLFGRFLHKGPAWAFSAAFGAGALSVLLSGILFGLALMFTEETFLKIAGLVVAAHVPVMIIEGTATGFCVTFLKKVQPSLLPSLPEGRRIEG
jgi:cobalt/nickel transport system permease protein